MNRRSKAWPRPAASAVLVAGLTLLAASGCSRTARLDMAKARLEITRSLTSTFDLPVTDTRCPDKAEVKAGASFRCQVRIADQPLTVRVVQRDDEGNLRVVPTAAVLVLAKVRTDLMATLAAQLKKKGVRVDCGTARVKVAPPGSTFTCKVSDGRTRKTVTVRVRDAAGSLTYTLSA